MLQAQAVSEPMSCDSKSTPRKRLLHAPPRTRAPSFMTLKGKTTTLRSISLLVLLLTESCYASYSTSAEQRAPRLREFGCIRRVVSIQYRRLLRLRQASRCTHLQLTTYDATLGTSSTAGDGNLFCMLRLGMHIRSEWVCDEGSIHIVHYNTVEYRQIEDDLMSLGLSRFFH